MSEEEKKAIEELKSHRDYFKWQPEGCNWRLSFDEEEVTTIIDVVLNLIEKQQKEIEELRKNSIGDTKSEKLLFSIKMLHFHNYITDKQFYEMIKKLSNIGE